MWPCRGTERFFKPQILIQACTTRDHKVHGDRVKLGTQGQPVRPVRALSMSVSLFRQALRLSFILSGARQFRPRWVISSQPWPQEERRWGDTEELKRRPLYPRKVTGLALVSHGLLFSGHQIPLLCPQPDSSHQRVVELGRRGCSAATCRAFWQSWKLSEAAFRSTNR